MAEVLCGRGAAHRLRSAIQLDARRATGRFVSDYGRVPPEALNHLACQLGLDPVLALPAPERPATETAQLQRIRRRLGWHEFDAAAEQTLYEYRRQVVDLVTSTGRAAMSVAAELGNHALQEAPIVAAQHLHSGIHRELPRPPTSRMVRSAPEVTGDEHGGWRLADYSCWKTNQTREDLAAAQKNRQTFKRSIIHRLHVPVSVPSLPTLVDEVRERLERDIISGVLAPERKLGIRALTVSYGVGPTPIREALSRMSETGLIRARGRHGFTVAPLSRADLADLTWLRRAVETEALQRAMQQGGAAWEAEIVASLHLLRRAARDVIGAASAASGSLAFDAEHKRFHRALIAACGSDRLLTLTDRLYDEAFRYRMIAIATRRWTRDVVAEHERLAELALARDAAAPAALDQHVADVLAMVYPDD